MIKSPLDIQIIIPPPSSIMTLAIPERADLASIISPCAAPPIDRILDPVNDVPVARLDRGPRKAQIIRHRLDPKDTGPVADQRVLMARYPFVAPLQVVNVGHQSLAVGDQRGCVRQSVDGRAPVAVVVVGLDRAVGGDGPRWAAAGGCSFVVGGGGRTRSSPGSSWDGRVEGGQGDGHG